MGNYKRVDDNQKQVVKALRQIPGCTVESLAAVGKGVPDLLVGYMGRNYLCEVKDGTKPPSKRRLTPDQIKWHNMWGGTVHVVTCFEDALEVIGL